MIYKAISITFLCVIGILSLTAWNEVESVCTYTPGPPRSDGAAAQGLGDRTGSPISGAGSSCANCHGGGSYTPTISIDVKDAGLNSVTSYIPGDTYTIEYTVLAGSGSPAGYGMQGVALNSSNGAAGNLFSPSTPNTQITASGGVQFLEHQSISPTGLFRASWTAPTTGTGAVSIYARGLAVNGTGSTIGDAASSSVLLSLSEVLPTTISYPGNPYCTNAANQTPVISGIGGGTFSSTIGLSINPSSGVIDIASSIPGTYTVTYDYTTGTAIFSVTINTLFSESASATICANETYIFGAQTLNASNAGSNFETFQSVDGCDSLVELTLSVLPSYSETASATICDGDTYAFGTQTLDASNVGLNTEIFQSTDGCDSLVELNLTVNLVDVTTTVNGELLTANQTGAQYQWLDCDNNDAEINGETGQSYTALNDGNYAVIVTMGGCNDTSECLLVDQSEIDELTQNFMSIYPNPVTDVMTISFASAENGTIKVYDVSGKLVDEFDVEGTTVQHIFNVPKGVYTLELTTENLRTIERIVKQ